MRALFLQAFYSIRSERQLVERIDYDLLFRWFVGLGIEDPVLAIPSDGCPRSRTLAKIARSAGGMTLPSTQIAIQCRSSATLSTTTPPPLLDR
jgi:hypothetical protein